MSPESERLQVHYSDFFDFRKRTKRRVNMCARWFMNDPLEEPLPPSNNSTYPKSPEEPGDSTNVMFNHSLRARPVH